MINKKLSDFLKYRAIAEECVERFIQEEIQNDNRNKEEIINNNTQIFIHDIDEPVLRKDKKTFHNADGAEIVTQKNITRKLRFKKKIT